MPTVHRCLIMHANVLQSINCTTNCSLHGSIKAVLRRLPYNLAREFVVPLRTLRIFKISYFFRWPDDVHVTYVLGDRSAHCCVAKWLYSCLLVCVSAALRASEQSILEKVNISLNLAVMSPVMLASVATMITLIVYTSTGHHLTGVEVRLV